MLKSNFILAFRNIVRNASNSLINISGLALGITCALLIFSLVTYHLNFDRYHKDADRIYRFVTEQHRDQVSYAGSVPPAFAKTFREDFGFAEKVARLCNLQQTLVSFEAGNELRKFNENVSFAEPEFFEIFSYPVLMGSDPKLLSSPNNGVVTERIAKKYFGDESPINKSIRVNGNIDVKIIGVLRDIPDNTDIRSEIFVSYSSVHLYNEWYAADDSWGGITTEIQTFGKLHPNVTPAQVEAELPAYVKKYRPTSKNVHHYKLQPLNDIHFNANYGGVMEKKTLVILSVIGCFLVFTACLNFINLATAQAVTRSKEIGVRKSLGSARSQLFWQFALETGVIVVLATFVGFALAYSVLPFLNELFNSRIHFELNEITLILFIPVLIIIVTLLSCTYPGLILSGYQPVQALKGSLTGTKNVNLRRSLVTAQFTISQVLLIGLIVVVAQMKFFKDKDMGYDHDAIVMIPTGSNDEKTKTLKARLKEVANVESVTTCFTSPSSQNRWSTSLTFDNRSEQENFSVSFRGGDEDFISTFGLKLVAGRNLVASDTVREFVINETLAEKLNLTPEEILGRTMRVNGSWTGPIVGVVKDFHDESLHSDINPVFITTATENFFSYGVKINMANSKETLRELERTWTEMYPELMYSSNFVEELTAQFYQTEETMLKLIEAFSFIALFIGAMGLYGMAAYMSLQKTKEIGIRKVLGGSVSHILWIFGKEFSRLIAIAFIIAAPVGWFLMSKWLENFAYRIELAAWIFIAEVLIIAGVVFVTVGYKALRSAVMNPVSALRTE